MLLHKSVVVGLLSAVAVERSLKMTFGVYTVILLAIVVCRSSGQCGDGTNTPGDPCLYNPSQQLADGCENVVKCRKGLASPFQCCAAVAHCYSENVYVYPPNKKFYLSCRCGQLSGAACPKGHVFQIDLGKCVPKPKGILSVFLDAVK